MKKLILLFIFIIVSTISIESQEEYKPFTKSYSYVQKFEKDYKIIEESDFFTKITFNYNHLSYVRIRIYVNDKPKTYTYYITSGWVSENKQNIEIKSAIMVNTHDNTDTKYIITIIGNFESIIVYNTHNDTGASFTNERIKDNSDIY